MNDPAAAAVPPMAGGDARYAENPAPLTVLDADNVVKAPVLAVVEPIGPGAANVVPPSVAALMLVLHVNPVLVVYVNALEPVLQLGIATAVGDALDAVTLATTVFAAWATSPDAVTFDQCGALDAPVDTIACPAVDPDGLSS
ncbi:TPA: hypothetical protein VDA67_006054 [Burkholderia vietnamiensis]|nr:hypothetical protein [Burkholderia vietnamiensis]